VILSGKSELTGDVEQAGDAPMANSDVELSSDNRYQH